MVSKLHNAGDNLQNNWIIFPDNVYKAETTPWVVTSTVLMFTKSNSFTPEFMDHNLFYP